MFDMLRKLKQNDFIRNNAIFFVGSLSISFVNYLYYPVLGRLLSIESFGELQVLISFFSQITIFITVLTLISTNVVLNEKDTKKANKTVGELEKITLYVALTILAIVTLLSPILQTQLKFSSPIPFIVITMVLVVGVSLGFRTAYLRGKSDFLATSKAGLIGSISKIIASVIFVVLGFSTAGAAGGILASQILALLYASARARRLGYQRERSSQSHRPDWSILRPQARYAVLVLFVSFICTLQYSVDVTIVKYLFSPEVAGQYAGIATISRIILFATGSFAVVLLSSAKISNTPKQNSTLLIRSLTLTFAVGGIATLLFVLFPVPIIHLLFGVEYDTFAHILPLLSIAMLIMSLCNLIANYHIALRHYWVMLYVGIGALSSILLVAVSHATPEDVVRSLMIGSVVMLVGLVGWTGYRAGFMVK